MTSPPSSTPPSTSPQEAEPGEPAEPIRAALSGEQRRAYWRSNLRCLALLLSLWFLVSFGCGILWVDALNRYHLPGTSFKLGFWFAQQGSIYAFVCLVFVYAIWMNHLDKKFDVEER